MCDGCSVLGRWLGGLGGLAGGLLGFFDAGWVELGGCCAEGFAGFVFEEVGGVVFDADEFCFDFGSGSAFPSLEDWVFYFDEGGFFWAGGEGAVCDGFCDLGFRVFEDGGVFLTFHGGVIKAAIDFLEGGIGEDDDGDGGASGAVGIFNEVGEAWGL